jgi:hypothetical protein
MKKIKFLFALVLLKGLTTASAYAQEAQGFAVGPFDVSPTLGVSVLKDDNVFEVSANASSDTITTITPGFSLVFDNGISGFALNYQLIAGYYSENTSEDYTDNSASATFGWAPSDFSRFELNASLLQSQDVLTPGVIDRYDDTNYSLVYTLGAGDSPFGLSLTAGIFEREYKSNASITQFDNYKAPSLRLGFVWRLSPDFDVTTAITQRDIDYDIDTNSSVNVLANSDSEEYLYDIGFNWDISEQTAIDASVGQNRKHFDDATLDDSQTARWNVALRWSPLSYSRFTLTTLRFQDESDLQQGDFSDRQVNSVSWEHDWTSRFSTSVGLSSANADYAGNVREDDVLSYDLSLTYGFNRWLDLVVFTQRDESDSTVDNFTYDRTRYGMSLLFEL